MPPLQSLPALWLCFHASVLRETLASGPVPNATNWSFLYMKIYTQREPAMRRTSRVVYMMRMAGVIQSCAAV